MNNTPGNAQRQGADPHRASTLNAIPSPKPHFHSKYSNFWFAHAKSKPKEPSLWFVVCGLKKSRPHQATCNALVYIGLMRTWSFTSLPLYLGRFAAWNAAKTLFYYLSLQIVFHAVSLDNELAVFNHFDRLASILVGLNRINTGGFSKTLTKNSLQVKVGVGECARSSLWSKVNTP